MRNRERKERKKGQESIIGKIIYGFLLFMPLLAILITCGYAMFNKNAYQSYASNDLNQITYEQLEDNTFILNKTYYVDTQNISRDTTSNIYLYDFELLNYVGIGNTNVDSLNTHNIYRLSWTTSGNISVYDLDENQHYNYILSIAPSTMFIQFNCKLTLLEGDAYKNVYNIVYHTNTFVSEVFYYSVDKVEQSNLFNWAQNNVIYTTTSATCNALSINNTFIPLLLSYWLIISVLYFLYDIALMLVWIVHRKIHEMQESI